MAKALYRKYRPKSLAEVVGQEQVTEVLKNSLKQGKNSHAYLFVGPRGTGKTSVARIFAHEINQFPYEVEDDYVDIIEMDGASNRGIENIRELREKAAIAPSEGKYKIYIIDEVHMLTRESFNALLKTLEEPPEHVIFIMATTDLHKVPATIVSRAQTYHFKLADADTMMKFLKKVAKQEKIQISDAALEIVVERGGGSFRDSLSLLDQISTLSEQEITRDLVVAAMGLPEKSETAEILDFYLKGELLGIVEALRKMLEKGTKAEILVEGLISRIMAEPKPELLPLLSRLSDIKAPFPEAKLLVALTKELQAGPAGGNMVAAKPAGGNTAATKPAGEDRAAEVVREDAAEEDAAVATKSTTAENFADVTDFDWTGFLTKVQDLNDAIYVQLKKVSYELMGNALHLYPRQKVVKNILSHKNNLQVLTDAAVNLKIIIHEAGEKPAHQTQNSQKDAMLAKISAIMGGEVEKDGGENPF